MRRLVIGLGQRAAASVLLCVIVVAGACSGDAPSPADPADSAPPDSSAPETAEPVFGADCTIKVAGDVIQAAVERARPGDVICVSGDHAAERVRVDRSGEPGRTVVIRGEGDSAPRVAGFEVRASYVAIERFHIDSSPRTGLLETRAGVFLQGRGLVVRNVVVENPSADGILCADALPQCTDTLIAGNVVRGADGSGVVIIGTGVRLEGNDVSGSRMVTADDADGVRFFGTNLEILRNRIHDILLQPLPGQRPEDYPHIDCFQTFDIAGLAIDNVVIAGNVCTNVEHQCLIATAGFSKTPTVPVQSRRLVFRDNICSVRGAQAVYLDRIHESLVAHNLIRPGPEFYGVAVDRARDVSVLNNVFEGTYWPYYANGTTRFIADGNLAVRADGAKPVQSWREPVSRWGVAAYAQPVSDDDCPVAPTALAVDRAVDIPAIFGRGDVDVRGSSRVVDGNGDGIARADIGPVEAAPSPAPKPGACTR